MRALDTSDEAARVQRMLWRRMGPERRVELAVRMSEDAREISRAGIRARHPDYSEAQVELALRRVLLGDALFRAVWPDAPLLPT
ncbi:MAG: hypothetical protein KC613_11200 [Myxococcales bacterium]|nr:hypothetical protein [Myxococcales bacterium]